MIAGLPLFEDAMTISYPERTETLGDALARMIASLDARQVTLREILYRLGDHGSLLLCALLCVPFLLPVSIPGVSTVFGLAILFLSAGIVANRTPWLPARIMDRTLDADALKKVLTRGLGIIGRVERVLRQRLDALTRTVFANRVNGLAILAGAVLLMFPLGLVPFSNTLPAFAILFLSLGMAQRDGLFVLAGYAMLAATTVYFAMLAYLVLFAGRSLASFAWG